MIANFVHQLRLVGMEDKLPAALEEGRPGAGGVGATPSW